MRNKQKGYSEKISVWLEQFDLTGQVDPKDCDMYLKFTDIENIKSYFEQSDERMRFRYRRKTGDDFKWHIVNSIWMSRIYLFDRSFFFVIQSTRFNVLLYSMNTFFIDKARNKRDNNE